MVAFRRRISLAGFASLVLASGATAAELPAQSKKANPEAAKHCNIAGSPGMLAANGVCVKISGYVSTDFNAGQIKPAYNFGQIK